jgi:hypothetical protein
MARALLRSAFMRVTSLAYLGLAAALLGGCQFYFHGDDDDCVENQRPDDSLAPAFLNPQTLACEDPYPHGGGCGDVEPYYSEGRADPEVDWAVCYGACSGRDETQCQQSDGCRAVYIATPGHPSFGGCYETAPSGPVQGGGCSGLDAYECSRHDDCSAMHGSIPGDFLFCEAEPPPCVLVPGWVELLRNPETGTCEPFGPSGTCGPDAEPPPPDWGQCGSMCENLDESSCKAADACRAIFAGTPAANGSVTYAYKACWPTAPSGPVHGGSCAGLGAQECSRHDDCIAQHDLDASMCPAGVACEPDLGKFVSCASEALPPPPCPTLDEAGCIGRSDCQPFYTGSDCTCTPMDCTCQTWTFDSCLAS